MTCVRAFIDLGGYIDDTQYHPLDAPALHSIHCLIDYPPGCPDSGFVFLKEPDDAYGGDQYSIWYDLGVDGTELVVHAMEQARSTYGIKYAPKLTITGVRANRSDVGVVKTIKLTPVSIESQVVQGNNLTCITDVDFETPPNTCDASATATTVTGYVMDNTCIGARAAFVGSLLAST